MPTRSRQRTNCCLPASHSAKAYCPFSRSNPAAPYSLVEVNQRLAVRVSAEAMALRLEQLAQRHMVVDLTIGDDADRLVFVVERLLAALHGDDREPRVAQAGQIVGKRAKVF